MKINTKFDIEDIVQLKYEFSDGDHKKMAYEVVGITVKGSYGGTETHYHLRALHLIGITSDDAVIGWETKRGYRANIQNDSQLGTINFTESELVPASKEVIKILNSH